MVYVLSVTFKIKWYVEAVSVLISCDKSKFRNLDFGIFPNSSPLFYSVQPDELDEECLPVTKDK